jgi:hypothetical protein
MALLNLVYRDELFSREVYRRTFDTLLERLPQEGVPSPLRQCNIGLHHRPVGTARSSSAKRIPSNGRILGPESLGKIRSSSTFVKVRSTR